METFLISSTAVSKVEAVQKIGTLAAQEIFSFHSPDLMLIMDYILPIKLCTNLVLSGLAKGLSQTGLCLHMLFSGVWEGK